jgi:hypothetical protein
MHLSRRTLLAGALALVASLVLASGSAAAAAPWTTFKTVVTSLKNPRGITFDAAGKMYVAEAGLPGPATGTGKGVTQTGAVGKYSVGLPFWSRSWSKSFNSAYTHEHGFPETIGPSGMNARGSQVLMIMGLNHHEVPAPQFGHLYQLSPSNGLPTDRGDIGDQQWAWTNHHQSLFPSDFPDSNPYGVVIARGEDEDSQSTVYVVDAGANTVSKVRADGTTHVIAYIPNETPSGSLPTRDATPTCAAQGPDGALYVGTLDLFRNFAQEGNSHVYRIELEEGKGFLKAAKVWASGLTTVTACGFDSSGNFWATEMFKRNEAGPPGDLVRISFASPGQLHHIGGGKLPFPGGVAQGPDGAIYVTVNSAMSSRPDGYVVRVS